MKAKDFPKLIPNSIRITKDVTYEIVYINEFAGETDYQYGECRSGPKQIVLNKNQPPTELLKTFLHECMHAISFEYPGLELTEKQVRILENSLFRVIKLNGLLR